MNNYLRPHETMEALLESLPFIDTILIALVSDVSGVEHDIFTFHGLADNSLNVFWIRPTGVAKIDLMMVSPHPVSLIHDELLESHNGGVFFIVRAPVHDLGAKPLMENLQDGKVNG